MKAYKSVWKHVKPSKAYERVWKCMKASRVFFGHLFTSFPWVLRVFSTLVYHCECCYCPWLFWNAYPRTNISFCLSLAYLMGSFQKKHKTMFNFTECLNWTCWKERGGGWGSWAGQTFKGGVKPKVDGKWMRKYSSCILERCKRTCVN